MPMVRLRLAISLDGFVAGPDQSVEHPLGVGGMRLFSTPEVVHLQFRRS